MEGSSTRRALMADMYKVMMSHVLTPAVEEEKVVGAQNAGACCGQGESGLLLPPPGPSKSLRHLALPSWAELHSDHHPTLQVTTWVQEASLQCRLERKQQLLPLVCSLQAVLQVFNGWPGVREVCMGWGDKEKDSSMHKGTHDCV